MSNFESIPVKDGGTTARTTEVNKKVINELKDLKDLKDVAKTLESAAKKDDVLRRMGLQHFQLSGKTDSQQPAYRTKNAETAPADVVGRTPVGPNDNKSPQIDSANRVNQQTNDVPTNNDVQPAVRRTRSSEHQQNDRTPMGEPLKQDETPDLQRSKPNDDITKTDVQVTRDVNKLPGGAELERQDQYDHLKLPNGDTIMVVSGTDRKGQRTYSYVMKERGKSSDITREVGAKDQFVVTMPDGTKVGVKSGRVVAIRKDNKQLNLREQNSLD